MHGENQDRKNGRGGRGRFGTGKSAAFGIADTLRVTTVRGGLRSKVQLTRSAITAMSSEDPIPVEVLEREIRAVSRNGTTVEIDNIHLATIDINGIKRYLERHLARWPKRAKVYVNNQECEYNEPPIHQVREFEPEGQLRETLGDVKLIVKISKKPLESDIHGISIYSNGVWHDTTLAGSEGREMAKYIFGEIDVPKLEEDQSPIAPFDVSRSMALNPNNHIVQAIYGFIGQKVEEIRRELTQQERQRRLQEEMRKLAAQAAEIAKVINEDFKSYQLNCKKLKGKAGVGINVEVLQIEDNISDKNIFGLDSEEMFLRATREREIRNTDRDTNTEHNPVNNDSCLESDSLNLARSGESVGSKRRERRIQGGFDVKFQNLGTDEFRATYIPSERTIYINLDHPQLSAARGRRSIDDPAFKRLAYEVAFSEYALALALEFAESDQYLDPFDLISDIRETLNRIALKGAHLYIE
jgi:hypothetical protein